MKSSVDLKRILEVAVGKVDSRKLEKLEQKLEDALGCPLSSQEVDDPIIIRHRLAEKLRSEGVSPGVVHSFEQLFMGIIRRASIEGLLPAPPEGPWTRAWQSVLDLTTKAQGSKSPLRSLASWATNRGLAPEDIQENQLRAWAKDLTIDREALPVVQYILSQWLPASDYEVLSSDSILLERLRKKALRGTVKVDGAS
jgi:hypothetical protein